jgi:hypothetical protein
MARPEPTKIYHITHWTNLGPISTKGGLLSDADMIERGGPQTPVGMSAIKKARLTREVTCHPGDYVGEYVPFFFCPRSMMLYILHRGNHVELTYDGGQEPIVHLEADLENVVAWAESEAVPWAFTTGNARAGYARFLSDLTDLDQVDWDAVQSNDFYIPAVKEGKQAEFLIRHFLPWDLVERIGVSSPEVEGKVEAAIATASHQPPVSVQPRWYF